jgi:hypothetical protein
MTNLEDLFGKPLYEYTDDMAVRDGILIPFLTAKQDTGHRITSNAWQELTTYHREHGSPEHDDAAFYRFFFAELLPLVKAAHQAWNNADILKTDYTFNTTVRMEGVLWYVPNERNGITIMLPEDY